MKVINLKHYLQQGLCEAFRDIDFVEGIDGNEDAEVMVGDSSQFETEVLRRMPDLRWLQSCRVGYDGVDLGYIGSHGILLTNARDLYSVPMAEDVVCKVLMGSTNALHYVANQRSHLWEGGYSRHDLRGQTVGILGTGSIATEVARRLRGFDVSIIGYKRTPVVAMPYFDEVYAGERGLEHVLSASDFVIVALSLSADTWHLLDEERLGLLKDGASIVNVARGPVVDQGSLTAALKAKRIRYAALDVFEEEPLPIDDDLWDLENVYVTPHVSGIVEENRDRLRKLVNCNFRRFLNGEPLCNVVSGAPRAAVGR